MCALRMGQVVLSASRRADGTTFHKPREDVTIVGVPHLDVVRLRECVGSCDCFLECGAGDLRSFPRCGQRITIQASFVRLKMTSPIFGDNEGI